ncbi:MAG: hypothetical protein H0U98_04240 [Alphaproteobacteria bacterium]|nr:hypothetical protein [Alphaproteobacteria bacterium]
MRITRPMLVRRWAITSLLAAAVFAVLLVLELRLKALSGFNTADLQTYSTGPEYRYAFRHWPPNYAAQAGFDLGLDYLLMPLYAAAFFYSGILARETFALRPGRARRILTTLAAVPIAGALLDAGENGLQFSMMLWGASDALAGLAAMLSHAKWMALIVGVVLLLGAVMGQAVERQKRTAKTRP